MTDTQVKKVKKPKDAALKPLGRIFPYLKSYKRHVFFALTFLFLAAATTLVLPLAIRRMIDEGFSAGNSAFINDYFSVLLLVAGLLALFSALRYYFVIVLGERVVSDLRNDVFANLALLSPEFFDRSQSGEIVSRLSADATQIKSAVGATASLALRNVILGIGAVIAMVLTSPKLALIVLLAIPFIVLPLGAFGRNVRQKSRAAQDMLAEATAYASEQIGAVRTMQAFTNENAVVGRFTGAVEGAFSAARASVKARAILTFFIILGVFSAVVGVLWIGAGDVMAGTMTAGQLSQFLVYAVIAAGALSALSEVWGELSQAAGAAERLVEILEEVPIIAPPASPAALPNPSPATISFENVNFSYPLRPDQKALDNLSFNVKSGETIAIVGPSGAGKSTLFALLLRFYDATSGKVVVDNVDVRDADPIAVRRRLALVPQDVTIFSASAAENIAFGAGIADQKAIVQAAQDAQADVFLTALPKGYDTELGERGVTLSGGQRQRLSIARAILRDAPILLLDEATSALDAESEQAVQIALERVMKGRTTLIIAHRLATILKADRILVMDKGTIVEEGTHESLVKQGGTYAKLARLQFERGSGVFGELTE